jgi:homoserine kinase
MRARCPASAANLGPGFDVLAVALNRYVEVEIEPADSLIVRTEGEGAGLFDDAGHLAARVAIGVIGHDRLSITVRSQIPVARGMGSSAALAVAAAAAAGARDPIAVGAMVDGHPENAAASGRGGLIGAVSVRGEIEVVSMPLDETVSFVTVVPNKALSTSKARRSLPQTIPREDAVFNLGRMALLLGGLADLSLLRKEAGEDRLHQDYRTPLYPEAPTILLAMAQAGALTTFWSGSGSTLIGVTRVGDATPVVEGARAALDRLEMEAKVEVLRPDREGLVMGEAARLPFVAS